MATTSVQIGLLTVTLDQESKRDREFFDGLETGMGCYYKDDLETRRTSMQDMIDNFNSISDERADFVPTRKIARAWLAGFVIGWITALNNPELANNTDIPPLSWVDGLTRKHTPLYRDLVLQTEEENGEARENSRDTEPLPLAALQEA